MNNFFTPLRTSSRTLRLMVIDTYSRTARPAVHTIAPESCPMMLSTMPDGPKPVATSSGCATTRRGRSDDLAVTGAGGEERCGGRAFEGSDAAPCAPHCTRTVSHYQNIEAVPPSTHGDAPKPLHYADTIAKPPIGRAPWRRPSRPACHSAGCGALFCHSLCKPLHWASSSVIK